MKAGLASISGFFAILTLGACQDQAQPGASVGKEASQIDFSHEQMLGMSVDYTAFTGTDGPQKAEVRIARTNQEWSALLSDVPRAPRRGLAEGQLGVGVFLGMRPTGGYALEVDRVVDAEGKLYVMFQEIAPKPDEIVTQALTYPWAVLIIETAPEGDPVIRVLEPGVVKPEQ